ncbi:BhlA/UviB family holin-like peptide [Niallia sp. RD1]|uniref:BhlA/UviB family holin-like peptide n=1 Tax=Niallia sp. RD1 TaxID=2962858 RepID=UPI0020C1A7BB|nr:BhlA/UviB family holin-like peptide [Niallia sp. RD1]UTI42442.1 BhlA/UviB family holin-like peptide [Niallia sp. RD1]
MDLTSIPIDQLVSNGIFAVLFIWLLVNQQKDSRERESRLTTQIEKQNEAQDRIVQSLERLETQISQLKEVK